MSVLNAKFPNGTTLSPDQSEELDLRVLAGGLAALNTALRTQNAMLQFLCYRYVLDHFDYNAPSYREFMDVKYVNLALSTFESAIDRSTLSIFLDSKQIDESVFEFIAHTHQSSDNE